MKKSMACLLISVIAAMLSTAAAQAQDATIADTIYVGGDIVTINDAQPAAEALAVKDGKILAVGDACRRREDAQGARDRRSSIWRARRCCRAFIDAHSHYISSLTVANQVKLYAPPAGPGKDPDSIVAELVKFRDAKTDPGGRADSGLRLRRERHAGRPPAEPRRSRRRRSPTTRCWSATSRCTARVLNSAALEEVGHHRPRPRRRRAA